MYKLLAKLPHNRTFITNAPTITELQRIASNLNAVSYSIIARGGSVVYEYVSPDFDFIRVNTKRAGKALESARLFCVDNEKEASYWAKHAAHIMRFSLSMNNSQCEAMAQEHGLHASDFDYLLSIPD